MATVRIEYYGVEGSGKNVTEAKRDAGSKIENALSGSYTPIILQAGDETIIVFRSPDGWQYGFLRNGELGSIQGQDKDKKEVERSARRHIGSNVTEWKTCFGPDDVHPIVKEERDRREIADNCKWQREMRRATEAGLDDRNARYWISGFTQFMTQAVPEALMVG